MNSERDALVEQANALTAKVNAARTQMIDDAAERNEIILQICENNLSQGELAKLLGLSSARVSQLIVAAKKARKEQASREFNARLYRMRAAAHVAQLPPDGDAQ